MKPVLAKKGVFILILFLIPSLLFNFYLYRKNQDLASSQGTEVIEVLDGDTILLEGDVRLRLRDIDAPELKFCGGEEAKNLLTSLVKGKKVVVKEQIIDKWGRPLALVYKGNVLVNGEILKSGWARYHHDQSSVAENLKEIADQAKKEEKGIYDKCIEKENPKDPKCDIKGNIDKNNGRKLYYFPGCAQYEFTIVEKDLGEDWFCTEIEAQKAGFAKAQTCD